MLSTGQSECWDGYYYAISLFPCLHYIETIQALDSPACSSFNKINILITHQRCIHTAYTLPMYIYKLLCELPIRERNCFSKIKKNINNNHHSEF